MKTTLLKRVLELWDRHDGMLVSQYVDGPAEPLMEEIRAELAEPEALEPYSPDVLAALEPPLGDCCCEEPWPTASKPVFKAFASKDGDAVIITGGRYDLTVPAADDIDHELLLRAAEEIDAWLSII